MRKSPDSNPRINLFQIIASLVYVLLAIAFVKNVNMKKIVSLTSFYALHIFYENIVHCVTIILYIIIDTPPLSNTGNSCL